MITSSFNITSDRCNSKLTLCICVYVCVHVCYHSIGRINVKFENKGHEPKLKVTRTKYVLGVLFGLTNKDGWSCSDKDVTLVDFKYNMGCFLAYLLSLYNVSKLNCICEIISLRPMITVKRTNTLGYY